ncbi:MAG: flagellar protein FlaG [Saccharospirillaceae bacterium]|nr:flagellar protein FlaG [Pseudomonadales bacterium]NRB80231.1 flagellar protein FlaG [Saccharospirillaceae bacterium]
MTDVTTNYGKHSSVIAIEKFQAIDKTGGNKNPVNADSSADVNVTQKIETTSSAEQLLVKSENKEQDKKIDKEELKQAVASLNQYVQTFERKLDFQLDRESGVTIIKVYDVTNDKLIRQIPNEEAITLAQHLNQQDPPHLFSAQV